LCLAENAIGPTAMRNDDILAMYSGKTDGVAHATKHFENLDLVVDMATLTGAQLVATG
jgi:probable aminopeptidase NPEPL1